MFNWYILSYIGIYCGQLEIDQSSLFNKGEQSLVRLFSQQSDILMWFKGENKLVTYSLIRLGNLPSRETSISVYCYSF